MSEGEVRVKREAGPRILVVDDEQIILDLMRRVLSREGYQVMTARHADDAMSEIGAGNYDLAITDVDLLRSDGHRLMGLMGKASPHTALVVMTGYPDEAVMRFARAHAQGLLAKPFALEQLLAVVRGALSIQGKDGKEPEAASRVASYLRAGVRA
jgi:DNA-binding NtrC family response regulator